MLTALCFGANSLGGDAMSCLNQHSSTVTPLSRRVRILSMHGSRHIGGYQRPRYADDVRLDVARTTSRAISRHAGRLGQLLVKSLTARELARI
jgi:hypothetical protein